MTWVPIEKLKVGDYLWVHSFNPAWDKSRVRPRWDFDSDGVEKDGPWLRCRITAISKTAYVTVTFEETPHNPRTWDLKYEEKDLPGWWTAIDPTTGKTVREEKQVIYKVAIGNCKTKDIPDPVLEKAIDAGERGVRRSLREWPYGKVLQHVMVNDGKGNHSLEFFFQDEAVALSSDKALTALTANYLSKIIHSVGPLTSSAILTEEPNFFRRRAVMEPNYVEYDELSGWCDYDNGLSFFR